MKNQQIKFKEIEIGLIRSSEFIIGFDEVARGYLEEEDDKFVMADIV